MTPNTRQFLWAVGAGGFLLLAIALGVAAFTRFDRDVPREAPPEEAQRLNDQAYDDSFLSVVLGIGCAFSLLACFACGQTYRRAGSPPIEA